MQTKTTVSFEEQQGDANIKLNAVQTPFTYSALVGSQSACTYVCIVLVLLVVTVSDACVDCVKKRPRYRQQTMG